MSKKADERAAQLIQAGRSMVNDLTPLFVADMQRHCKGDLEGALYFSGMLAALGGHIAAAHGFEQAKAMFLHLTLGIAGAEERMAEMDAVKH